MRKTPDRQSRWMLPASIVTLLAVMTGTALAVNPATGMTTTNQELGVEIELDPDPGVAMWLGQPLHATAVATIGPGEIANVVYVMDVSGSMENPDVNALQDIVPPGGIGVEDDCNGDGLAGSALDAACFGLLALNQSLGSGPNIDVGLVAFGSGAKTADMSPDPGAQHLTSPPDVDVDGSGGPDVEQVIRSTDTEVGGTSTAGIGQFTLDISAGFGGSTNYDAAITAMNGAFASVPATETNRAVFISDGDPTVFSSGAGSPLSDVAPTTIVDTYAIGSIAPGACDPGRPLLQIADSTGGTCTEVADPSTLATLLPVAMTNIAGLELRVGSTSVDSVSGSEPETMQLSDLSIGGLLVPGPNLVQAIATAGDGTTVTAELVVEVVDLRLTPPHAVNELGIDNVHTVTATLLGSPSLVAGQSIFFAVTGQNPIGPTTVMTNAAGLAQFTYTVPVEPESLGLDSISASATIDGDEAVRVVTKQWVDTTPPEAECSATVNPSGKAIPKAPGHGGQGQNQDGFYELSASDDVFGNAGLHVVLTDSESGTEFGPFPVGTRVKYTEANGTTPRMKAMGANNGSGGGRANAVDYHIWGNGDGYLSAVDGSGNVSAGTPCLVPPFPK